MSFLQKLQKAHRYFFASCWTWWWYLLPNLLRQDVMARQICWSFRHYPYYWRRRRAYKLSKMQWKGKSKRLSIVYYVSMFWGFFEPPTCLKTDTEKKIVNSLMKHYFVFYLFLCISLYLCNPVSVHKNWHCLNHLPSPICIRRIGMVPNVLNKFRHCSNTTFWLRKTWYKDIREEQYY